MAKPLQKKVVVIQDASREISLSALEWALTGLKLEPGDELILLSVLHQVINPMGYKSKVDSSSIFGTNNMKIKQEIQKKKEEYQNSMGLVQIHDLYEASKIEFSVVVIPASSPKIVAMEAAKTLNATWIILDRQMKKDKKYFLANLACGISRMKKDNSVELLRGPKTMMNNTMNRDSSRSNLVTYDEMVPGIPDDDELFSLELYPIYSKNPNTSSESEEPSTDGHKKDIKSPSISNSMSSNNLSLVNLDAAPCKNVVESSTIPTAEGMKHSPHQLPGKDSLMENGAPNAISSNQRQDQGEDIDVINQYSGSRQKKSIADPDCFTNEVAETFTCSQCKDPRPTIKRIRDFTYGELNVATEKFSKENYLSEGGFGPVYKGKLADGQWIAVKKHKHASLQGEKEFKREVDVLSKARHDNVVMLLGSCTEGNHRLLVYEYICNGSLDQHLSNNCPNVLSWKDRLKIALGVAKGLQYLHSNDIIHRDMRPDNILVTHDYVPLLGDFGLARTQREGSDNSSETRVVGTIGYLAPEYAETGKVSKKADVYSFGVVLLELISGKRTLDKSLQESSLVGWAKPLMKERNYQELIDRRIMDSHDVHQLFGMVQVIEWCLNKDPDKRYPMDKVLKALNCVNEGKRITGIEDFSPPHTHISISKKPLNEPQGDGVYATSNLNGTHSVSGKTSTSEVNSSPASSTKTLSSSTATSSDNSGAGSRKGSKKKKGKSGSPILYGEMLM